jgi:hypothetical protein
LIVSRELKYPPNTSVPSEYNDLVTLKRARATRADGPSGEQPGVNASRLSVGYSYSMDGLMFTAASRATALRIWRGGSVGNYAGLEVSMLTFLV